MQHERRHNPYPWTWEVPAGVACAGLLVLALGVHLGNGLAHLTTGQGWTWPTPSQLFTSIPTVLTNSPKAGAGVQVWIVGVELMLIATIVWAGVASWRRWGPSRLKGVATRDQAEQVLGVTRLRKIAPIVRPDLNPVRRTSGGNR